MIQLIVLANMKNTLVCGEWESWQHFIEKFQPRYWEPNMGVPEWEDFRGLS
jgi:hypothetical protein